MLVSGGGRRASNFSAIQPKLRGLKLYKMLVRAGFRATKNPSILPLPFLYIGGYRRSEPPLFAICQVDGWCTGNGKGMVGARLIKVNTLACEFMQPLYVTDTGLEAELSATYFGLQKSLQSNEGAVGLETVSLALFKALLFAEQPLPTIPARVLKGKILETAREMDWVGMRWIPDVANAAKRVPYALKGPLA